MSLQLDAKIYVTVTLADVLAQAQSILSKVPHSQFAVENPLQPSEICVGPFDVRARGPQRYKELLTIWEHKYLPISLGPIARVTLAVGYCAFPHEIDPSVYGPAEAAPGNDDEERGYHARIDADRTRASLCLAALLAASIADQSRSRIVDEGNLLKQGRVIHPASVAAMFAKHHDAGSFEALADAFCDEIDFAPNWARARDMLAKLQRSSH
jgi:hypothetical protein